MANAPEVFVCQVPVTLTSKDGKVFNYTFINNQRNQTEFIDMPFRPDSLFVNTNYLLCEIRSKFVTDVENENTDNNSFDIFPNPVSSDNIFINAGTKNIESIEIYDELGNLVINENGINKANFELKNNLNNGNYFVRVRYGNSYFVKPLQIVR